MMAILIPLHFIFIASELGHIVKHSRVLWGIGKPIPEEWFWQNRSYFIFDLLSAAGGAGLVGLTAYLTTGVASTPLLAFLATIALGHLFLHALYIEGWKSRRSRVQKVIAWSAVFSNPQRKQQFGSLGHWGHALGTAFDIAAHVVIIGMLFRNLLV